MQYDYAKSTGKSGAPILQCESPIDTMHNPQINASRKARKRARAASVKVARKLRAMGIKLVAFMAQEN